MRAYNATGVPWGRKNGIACFVAGIAGDCFAAERRVSCKTPQWSCNMHDHCGRSWTPEAGVNILVVDDEISLRRTIRTALESTGHAVSEAGSQAQALQQIGNVRPDLVLLDLRLGRESGLDVLAALLAAAPGLGVVVITAYASVDTAVEAMRRGALDYLPKPFTSKQLADLIAKWGGRGTAEGNGDAAVLDSSEPAMRGALIQYGAAYEGHPAAAEAEQLDR